MAETGASVYNPGGGTGSANAQIIDSNAFTLVNTTSSSVMVAGTTTTMTVASTTNIFPDSYITIDSSSATETGQVLSIAGSVLTLYRPVQNAHNGTVTAFPVVAKLQRQVGSIGSPTVVGNIAEVGSNGGLNTNILTPVLPVIGYTSGAPVTGNITAAGVAGAVTAVVSSAGNITIQVTGTYVAAFTFQMSSDGGTTWINYSGTRFDDSGNDSVTPVLTNVVQGWNFSAPAVTNVRVYASTYTSGTAAIRISQGSLLFTESVCATIVQPVTRQRVILSVYGGTSVTAETGLSFSINKGGVVTAAQSTYTVSAGRTFRLQQLYFSTRITTFNTTAITAATNTFRLRIGPGITGSIEFGKTLQGTSNAIAAVDNATYSDGIEYSAGTVLVLTQQASGTTLTSDFVVVGYEY